MVQNGKDAEQLKGCCEKFEHRLSGIIENISDAFIAYNRDWRFTYVNSEAERILGIQRDKLLGKVHWEICPIAIGNEIEQLYRQVMERREIGELEYQHRLEDKWLHTWISFKAFPLEDGGIAIVFRDITEQKRAEEALRESEELYRLITESSTDLIVLTDLDGNTVYVSPSIREIMGVEPQQVLGISAFATLHPEDAPTSKQGFARALAGKTVTFQHRARHAAGDWRWLEGWGRVVKFRGRPHVLAVSRDITERKRAEKSLTLFRSLLDHTNDSIEVVDSETGRFLDVNEKACRACGYSREEYLTLSVRDIDSLAASRPWQEIRDEVKRYGSHIFESRHRRKDGSLFPVEVNVSFIHLDRDYILTVVRDISERKRSEEYVRKLSQAIEQSPISIVITDIAGDIEFINSHFAESTGYSLAEVLGRNSRILKSGETSGEEYRQLWQTISAGGVWRGEFHNRNKNGELFWEQATIAPLRDAENRITHYVAFKEDITKHKALEERFFQAQKIESIGRLAGGVAHDFNNMLGVIIGHTEIALSRLAADHPLFAALKEIHKAANRSADLTRQLLAFARKQTIDPKVFDLNLTVTGMLKMLRRLIGEDIDLAWLPAAEELPVKMDPSQLDQILANLCVNARDAITGVGKVTIETHLVKFTADDCSTHPDFVPGEFVLLAVSDNGCGMDHKILSRIFEPFFTTKELGKGTGLGLATVYGIVKQNNGFINVYSELNQGTTYKIYLPQYSVGPERHEVEGSILPDARGDETILLVEDELSYLDIARQMLESLGYRVLAVASPDEAVRIAGEHPGKIQLLMTDVIMPGMNGRVLAQALASLCPGIGHLFMSGYTSDVIAHHGILDAGVNYIQKPFSLPDLAAKVRKALEGD
jgi:PAS domain S-box-containing protein